MKKVLDVGQCAADHGAIRRMIEENFAAQVCAAHDALDALAQLRTTPFDLVLVNRKLDSDLSDGMDVIRSIKNDPALAGTSVILVSNYPKFQAQAVAAGAEPGFGKAHYDAPETRALLKKFLG